MSNYIQAFFWGIIIAITIMLIEIMILPMEALSVRTTNRDLNNFVVYLVVFALLEEAIKYIIVKKKINQIFKGQKIIIGSLICGAGFSMIEGLVFYQKIISGEGIFIIGISVGVILLHLATFAFFGYIVNKHKNSPLNWLAVLLATVLHFGYNLWIFKL